MPTRVIEEIQQKNGRIITIRVNENGHKFDLPIEQAYKSQIDTNDGKSPIYVRLIKTKIRSINSVREELRNYAVKIQKVGNDYHIAEPNDVEILETGLTKCPKCQSIIEIRGNFQDEILICVCSKCLHEFPINR